MKVREEVFMKSTFTLKSYDEVSDKLIDEAFSLIGEFERKYTVFHSSYFNQINESAGIESIEIDEETIELLNLSKKYFILSEGVFNIAFLNPKYNFNDIQIDPRAKKIYLPYSDMRISLGGVGKGYIVDKVFNFLHQSGVRNFSINGGGDLRVSSSPNAPRPWRIGISNPFNPKNTVGHIALTNHAFATSGTYIKGNHIHTSEQNDNPISVSILGETTVEADILATIGLTKNVDTAKRFYDSTDIWATIIDYQGKVTLSKKALLSHYQ